MLGMFYMYIKKVRRVKGLFIIIVESALTVACPASLQAFQTT